jgi:hypothetical protein
MWLFHPFSSFYGSSSKEPQRALLMQWTAPTTGIAMSEFGYERTFSRPKSTSALPPGADNLVAITDFRVCDPEPTLMT